LIEANVLTTIHYATILGVFTVNYNKGMILYKARRSVVAVIDDHDCLKKLITA